MVNEYDAAVLEVYGMTPSESEDFFDLQRMVYDQEEELPTFYKKITVDVMAPMPFFLEKRRNTFPKIPPKTLNF